MLNRQKPPAAAISLETWEAQIPAALELFARRAQTLEGIDLNRGVLPAAVLWPLRKPLGKRDRAARDALQEVLGPAEAGAAAALAEIVSAWGDDPAAAARSLAERSAADPAPAPALSALVARFDAVQGFLAAFLRQRLPAGEGGGTYNIQDIQAAIVNVGGITDIRSLTLQLDLPPAPPPPFLLRSKALYGLAAVLVLGALAALAQFALPRLQPPPPMTGDFNVAVARFGEVDAAGRVTDSQEAAALARSTYEQLAAELEQFASAGAQGFTRPDIQARSPEETGPIRGRTPDQRAEAARKLAESIGADLVLYGNVRIEGGKTTFLPEFYLSPRQLQQAQELGGPDVFGSGIESRGSILENSAARAELRGKLIGRANALAAFVVGLTYYVRDQFDEADPYFRQAAEVGGWADTDGKEVLYLFLGNNAGWLRDLEAAAGYYARALELNPEYARAQVGAAEIQYLQAAGDPACDPAVIDPFGVEQAITAFQTARGAAVQPPLADIPAKIDFHIGRAALCLSQAEVEDRYDEARRAYESVIAAYEAGNPRLDHLAAESHADLGLIALQTGEPDDPQAALRQALAEYDQAVALSRFPDRQALFHSFRGFIFFELGETDQAEAAYAEAIRLDPEHRAEYEAELQELQGLAATPEPVALPAKKPSP